MVELGGGLRLTLKLIEIAGITGQRWRQQLYGDSANRPAVSSLVECGLAARAEALFEGVSIRQLLPGEVRQFREVAAKAEARGGAEPYLGIQWKGLVLVGRQSPAV